MKRIKGFLLVALFAMSFVLMGCPSPVVVQPSPESQYRECECIKVRYNGKKCILEESGKDISSSDLDWVTIHDYSFDWRYCMTANGMVTYHLCFKNNEELWSKLGKSFADEVWKPYIYGFTFDDEIELCVASDIDNENNFIYIYKDNSRIDLVNTSMGTEKDFNKEWLQWFVERARNKADEIRAEREAQLAAINNR